MKNKHSASAPSSALLRILLTLCLLAVTVSTVSASAPARNEAFVYAISAFDGQVYRSTFAPANTKTIYLMENESNVLVSKETEVYFWPLTQKYNADWLAENNFVDGTLEILQGGRIVKSIPPQAYVIQYDSQDPIGTRNLAVGKEAVTAYDNFTHLREAYQDALVQYNKDFQTYSDEVSRIVSDANGAPLSNADFPTEPAKVADFTLYSTEIANGFVFALPAGNYSVQLRLPDGSLQAGSQKQLVVFAKLRRAIAYKVIPAERWTAPDYAQEPDGVIYAPNNSTLYLVPYLEYEYNQQAYQRMIDPQETASRADQTQWVSFDPYGGGQLVLGQGTSESESRAVVSYTVSQTTSSGLGYTIDVFDAEKSSTVSFSGYRLDLDAQHSQYTIALKDADGKLIEGSTRQVRVLNTSMRSALYGIAFLPLLIGLIVIVLRNISVKKIKVEG